MSSITPSVASVGSDAYTTSTDSTQAPQTAAQAEAALAAQEADAQTQAHDRREEQAKNIFANTLTNTGKSFAGDDADNNKDLTQIKHAASGAGMPVSDKALKHVANLTANDPGTKQLVSKLADPADPDTQNLMGAAATGQPMDLAFIQRAYAASPAASPSAQPSSSAVDTTAASNSSGGASTPTEPANSAAPAAGTASTATDSTMSSNLGVLIPGEGQGALPMGNWSAFVAMAMYNATAEMQTDKKSELSQIKMFNSMLDAVNNYVSNTLMPAQQDLQTRIAAAGNKATDKSNSATVTIYDPIYNLDTDAANMDPVTGKAVLIQGNTSGASNAPAEKVTQTQLASMISQADQWRQSISNNQQLHSSNFQSLDTQVTSFLNMITTLYKNVNDTQTGIIRNLPT